MSPSVTYFQYCYSRYRWCLHTYFKYSSAGDTLFLPVKWVNMMLFQIPVMSPYLLQIFLSGRYSLPASEVGKHDVIPDTSEVSLGYLLSILFCYSRYQWTLHRLLTSNTFIPDTSEVSLFYLHQIFLSWRHPLPASEVSEHAVIPNTSKVSIGYLLPIYCYSTYQWSPHRLLTSNTVIPDTSDVSTGYLLPILLFQIPVMSPSVTYFQYCYSKYQ